MRAGSAERICERGATRAANKATTSLVSFRLLVLTLLDGDADADDAGRGGGGGGGGCKECGTVGS